LKEASSKIFSLQTEKDRLMQQYSSKQMAARDEELQIIEEEGSHDG